MVGRVSGVILAGGASRRMGRDKAFLELVGQPLIALIAQRLRMVTDEVIIAANKTERYAPFADRCVPDNFPGVGTLGGIHAGLRAAAHELAAYAAERGIHEEDILPRMDEWEVFPRTAVATAMKAQEQGVARLSKDSKTLYEEASRTRKEAREAAQFLMQEGFIRQAPEA